LAGFDREALEALGIKVRDLYLLGADAPDRIRQLVDDPYISDLADAVTGVLGGKVGIAPRIFLKKLIGDVLDRVDQFADFAPRQHYALTLAREDLSPEERNAVGGNAATADDVELDL
jgi:hypothetical protein